MRDIECVLGVLVAEQVEKVVKPAPGDPRQAQRARLVGAYEDAVLIS